MRIEFTLDFYQPNDSEVSFRSYVARHYNHDHGLGVSQWFVFAILVLLPIGFGFAIFFQPVRLFTTRTSDALIVAGAVLGLGVSILIGLWILDKFDRIYSFYVNPFVTPRFFMSKVNAELTELMFANAAAVVEMTSDGLDLSVGSKRVPIPWASFEEIQICPKAIIIFLDGGFMPLDLPLKAFASTQAMESFAATLAARSGVEVERLEADDAD